MENRDSDQSISEDEEDVNILDWPTNPTSIHDKGVFGMYTSERKDEKFIPSSSRRVLTSSNDEETISDIEENNVPTGFSLTPKSRSRENRLHNYEIGNQDEASTWSTVHKEAEDLIFLHDNAGSSSSHGVNPETKKSMKGCRGKVKPKFAIQFQTHKGPSLTCNAKDESTKVLEMHEELEDVEDIVMEHSMIELLGDFQEENKKQSEVQVSADFSSLEHRDTEHSISELLGGLQENNESVTRTSKLNIKPKRRKHWITGKRSVYTLGNRTLDKEVLAEPMDSDTSCEDEASKLALQANDPCQMKLANLETEGMTIADRFHEALNATKLIDGGGFFGTSKQTGMGYYGRLQQILQIEKDRHAEFLNRSQDTSHDETKCIGVKILSRYLDAKLIVCECSFLETNKVYENSENGETKKTIIFSSRMCDNVEIKVGNFILIHPPWKEVQVMGDDKCVILCTYFSQIST